MGLDMYAHLVNAAAVEGMQVDVDLERAAIKFGGFNVPNKEQMDLMTADERHQKTQEFQANFERITPEVIKMDFFYWRKFNHLHGWMEQLYRQKGGTEEFNCTNVRVDEADLDRLLDDVATLKPTTGFFFGNQGAMHLDDLESLTSFVAQGKEKIKEGYAIFYSSWW